MILGWRWVKRSIVSGSGEGSCVEIAFGLGRFDVHMSVPTIFIEFAVALEVKFTNSVGVFFCDFWLCLGLL